jgi:zinc transport system substrate-binding protein
MKIKSAVGGLVLLGALSVLLGACTGDAKPSGKVQVVASFDAMAEFARAVGGEKVDVVTMTPAGTEPHDFEPKAADMVTLSQAQVFVYNGLGMEGWAQQAIDSANNPKLTVVKASEGALPIDLTDPAEIQEHGQYDPHLWISLAGAALEAQNIATALSKVDPSNAGYYSQNLKKFTDELGTLRAEYQEKFKASKSKSFVTGHAAFAYFCRDFGLEQNSVEDTFAEGEPTAKAMADLVDYCRKHGIKSIFVEDQVSPAVSQALASEIGGTFETIATIESPEEGKTYLDRQKENLAKVLKALN